MANRDPKKRPQDEGRAPTSPRTASPRTAIPPQPQPPQVPPPQAAQAAKKEDISRWEGEGGAPPKGSQGRSKDGDGTGKTRAPRKA